MSDARKAALTAIEKCRRSSAWSDAVLGAVMDAEKLTERDRGLATALCYGIMQRRMLLDYYISLYSSIKPAKIEPKVLDILRLGALQILFMDKIPPSAAVNESVRLSRELGFARAAGFVNALLRKLASCRDALPEVVSDSEAGRLSIVHSCPKWLVEEAISLLGAEEAGEFLSASNVPPVLYIQTNTLKTDTARLAALLGGRGFEVSAHPLLPDCLTACGTGSVAALPEFQKGLFYIQDPAAKAAVTAAGALPGHRVLDCCAAPGGKSFAAAILSGDRADISSCDIHENKLRRIKSGAERLGIECIRTFARDAREFDPGWEDKFDVVIADVPCSGLGVIRKKPDIRYKDPAELAGLPAIQMDILRSVSRYVRPGGVLLYSTCTVRREENGDVVSGFLSEHGVFAAEDFETAFGPSRNGCLQLWPQRHGTDGFFISKMRKRS